MKKTICLFAVFVLHVQIAHAQNHQGVNISGSFGKFIDVPVNHYTGQVTPMIGPLVSTGEGPLKTGLTLSFNTTGMQAGQLAGPVGEGVHLGGGGVIYRTRRHLLDEDTRDGRKGYYLHGGTLAGWTSNHTELENGTRDGEADLFYFYMPGYSGKFRFAGGDGSNPGDIVLIPQQDLKIEITDIECPATPGALCYIRGFIITDALGVKYYFGKYNANAAFAVERTIDNNLPGSSPVRDYASAWYLAKIETVEGKHYVEYKYRTSNYKYETLAPSELKITHVSGGSTTQTPMHDPYANVLSGSQIRYHTMSVYSKVLDSIVTRTMVIDFDHTIRTDVSVFTQPDSRWAISGLTAHLGSEKCVKWSFNHSYFTDGSGQSDPWRKRLKLEKVQKISCDDTEDEPPYEFTHFAGNVAPRLTHELDHYGGYNGKTSNNTKTTLVPTTLFVSANGQDNFTYGTANRDVDTAFAKRGLLTKITLPTGGYHEFTHEANKALDKNAMGAKDIYKVLAAGRSSPASPCSPSTYTDSYVQTLSQDQIDHGAFILGISSHFGNCNGSTTNVSFKVYQNGNEVTSLARSLNHNIPTSLNQVFLAGNGLDTLSPITFELTVNNEGRGYVDLFYYPPVVDDVVIGGFRVKKMLTHDGISSSRDIIRYFKYRKGFGDSKSSGVYVGKPRYGHLLYYHSVPTNYEMMAEPFSLAPLSSFEGYHVGYTRVEEEHNGNGTIVHTFRNEPFNHSTGYPGVGIAARILAGSPDTLANYHDNGTVVSYTESSEKAENYLTPGNINIRLRQIPGMSTQHTHKVYNDPTRNPFRAETTIESVDGVEKETTIDYTSTYVLSPTSFSYTNSDGKETKVSLNYTANYYNGLLLTNYFRNNHILGNAYETEIRVDGNLIDGTRTLWSFFDTGGAASSSTEAVAYPHQHQRYERTWLNGVLQGGAWRTLDTLSHYDMRFGFPDRKARTNWSADHCVYDTLGNKINSTFEGFTKSWEYFAGSSILKRTTAIDGQQMEYTLDKLLRPDSILDLCSGTVTTMQYDFRDAANNNYNKITTKTDFVQVNGSDVDVIEEIDYQDGLSRSVQGVRKGQSQSDRDIVNGVEYDNQGRPYKVYESYHAVLGNNGAFVSIPGTYDHTLHEYEDSPLSRLIKNTPPFLAAVENVFRSNAANEVSGYGSNTLRCVQTKDGNGHYSLIFKDLKGRRILNRRTSDPMGSIHTDTYYDHDDKNRLTIVLPPGTTASDDDLIFQYSYDARDHVLSTKIPGKDLVEIRYSERDLRGYYRDGYLRSQNKWYGYNHDVYGRETESGFTSSAASNHTFDQVNLSEKLTEDIYGTASHEKDKLKTVKSKILGTSSWLETTLVRNVCGQVISSSGNSIVNLSPGSESRTFTLDWTDNILTEMYTHQGPVNTNILHKRTFDHVGREDLYDLTLNGGTAKRITDLDINHKEEMTRMAIGPGEVQVLDFTHKPNGLLEKINTSDLSGGDLFYEELRYHTGLVGGLGVTAQYNGNIANVISKIAGNNRHVYGMTYDFKNQMTKATYKELTGSGSTFGLNDYTVDPAYDARGNITGLSRKGRYWNGSQYVIAEIDNLDYTMSGNKLTMVTDNAPSGSRHHGYHKKSSANYQYDNDGASEGNGNLTFDPRSGASFTYNHLDVPVMADFGDGKTIHWTYDARRNMLGRKVMDGTTVLEDRKYVGEIEYDGNQITAIYHPQGRIRNTSYVPCYIDVDGNIIASKDVEAKVIHSSALLTGNGTVNYTAEDCIELQPDFDVQAGTVFEAEIGTLSTPSTNWVYEYFIRDHLGNLRVVFDETAKKVNEHFYYPFGMARDGGWGYNNALAKEKYQFNSIEYVENHGMDLNVARYRMLDPSLGRWFGVDPAAHDYMPHSPFNFAVNSPGVYSDPEGDIPLLALAVAGAMVRGSVAHEFGGNFYREFALGFGTSFATAGFGSLFGQVGTAANEIGRAVAHGVVGGLDSHFSGGSFGNGFFSGALGSGFGSAFHGAGAVGQLAGSGLAGLGGSLISGGNPWMGLGQGLGLAALNHLMHTGDPVLPGGDLPMVTVRASRLGAPNISYVTGAGALIGSALTATGQNVYGGGKWRGANGKYYSTSWGGNQYTGGRSVARYTSTAMRATGTAFGALNYAGIYSQYSHGELHGVRLAGEVTSNTITTFGGIYGVAWGIGWEGGRVLTNTGRYQSWKRNNWLPFRRKVFGY